MRIRVFYILTIFISILQLSAFAGGDGSEGNPYQVSTLDELQETGHYSYRYKHFIQINDIDASPTATWNDGDGFVPIGYYSNKFAGSFDGQGFVIDGLYSHGYYADGLFGVTENATLSNIILTNCTIIGNEERPSGGLVAHMQGGSITGCIVTGSVTGEDSIGGIAGELEGGEISLSYSDVIVSTIEYSCWAGGLVGYSSNFATITDCYARGPVTSQEGTVGGLVGYLTGTTVTRCYSSGLVTSSSTTSGGLVGSSSQAVVEVSFWDIETSGKDTSAEGTGMTTAAMKDPVTYFGACWDFVSETLNGTEDVWDMDQSGNVHGGYPYLNWEDGATEYLQPHTLVGSGTEANPFRVSGIMDLWWLSTNSDLWDKHFVQTTDLDLSSTREWNDGDGFKPIGDATVYFTGSYNGQNFHVDNLFIDRDTDENGLFGKVGAGEISNLQVLNCDITGAFRTAAVVAYCNGGTITNCYSTGTVSTRNGGGGITGRIVGTLVDQCATTVEVSSYSDGSYCGGLVGGAIESSTITNSNALGSVSGDSRCGGLVGTLEGSTVENCYAHGSVRGVSQCGGLVGTFEDSTVENCYALGGVSGESQCGGLVGSLEDSTIEKCFSAGSITANETVGGLVGYVAGTNNITGCFWDTETSGQSTSEGGEGKTTAEMKYLYMYHGAGWDLVAETRNGTANTWDIDLSGTVNDGYPFLSWQDGDVELLGGPSGSGTSSAPYLVATLYDLYWMGANSNKWSKHYLQTADIDATDTANWYDSTGFYPIGSTYFSCFSGEYNGQGYSVNGLFIHGSSREYVGLFGYARNATIRNVMVIEVDIQDSGCAGALAGSAYNCTINDCQSSGTVESYEAGGLIGRLMGSTLTRCSSSAYVNGSDGAENANGAGGLIFSISESTVRHSYATGDVDCYSIAGGLTCSLSNGDIYDCFSTGNVDGLWSGGLVGKNSGEIYYCYSTGSVADDLCEGGLVAFDNGGCVTGSFWDIETSGRSASAGGTGLTTTEMQTVSTYLDAGWDMAGEALNGTEDIWILLPDQYPSFTNNYIAPVITVVKDVPGDQGHQLELAWNSCEFDTFYNPSQFYVLWRLAGNTRAIAHDAVIIDHPVDFITPEEDDTRPIILQDRDQYWSYVVTVPASAFPVYGYVAPTVVDSCAAMTAAEYTSTYKVIFYFEDGYLSSQSVSGYSVDNVSPYATSGVTLALGNTRTSSATLRWDEVTEGGFGGNSYPELNGVWYRVYAGDTPDFQCNESTLFQTTRNTSIEVDPADAARRFFKIVVSDQQ